LLGALALDLALILAATLAMSVVVVGLFVAVRVALQGATLGDSATLTQTELLRLIGVDGILVVIVLQNLLFVAVPIIRVRWLQREPLTLLGLQADRPVRLVLLGMGLGVLVLIANALLSLAFASIGIRQNQAAQYPLFPGDTVGQILFLVGAALIVPFGEEVLFRGYVFGAIRRSGASWSLPAAYVVSALIFAVAHSLAASEGLIALLTATFLMGLALAWAFQRTGSIIPSFIAHAVNNGVALLGLLTCVNTPGLCPPLT
jgi:hypothetical protein